MGKKHFLLWLLASVYVLSAPAQPPSELDSLLAVSKSATSVLKKAEALYELGDAWSAKDTIKAIAYINEGLAYAKGNTFYEGMGHFFLGRVYMDYARQRADAAFDTAIRAFERLTMPEAYVYQSRSWANKAVLAQLRGDNEQYIDLFLHEAIPLAAKGGDSLRMADGYANIALPFMNYDQYDKAVEYLTKSIAIFERLAPNDLRQIDNLTNMAKISLLREQTENAKQYLDRAAAVLAQAPESAYAPYFHTVESMYFIKQENWEEAGVAVDKGLAVAQRLNNRYDIRQLLYQKARLYDIQQHWAAARTVLLKMYDEGYVDLPIDQKQLFGDLARLESHLGNHRAAYAWMVRHAGVAEELYARQTNTQIADLEAKYNIAQKEKELLLSREKAKRQETIIWAFGIGLSFLGILSVFWYRNRRLRALQQIERLKQQQRIDRGRALLEGEERERQRIARDLHDGLGGLLAGIKLNLSQMIENRSLIEREDLGQTIERLGHSVDELRRIARNMMPESLVRSGLQVALRDLCDEATLPTLNVTFNAFDIPENLSPQVQLMIYRIVQELVHNAVKHAEASKIMVQCSQAEEIFFITVEDNGKGFSSGGPPMGGAGLENIRSRVDFLRGNLSIESTGEGTIVNIELHVER